MKLRLPLKRFFRKHRKTNQQAKPSTPPSDVPRSPTEQPSTSPSLSPLFGAERPLTSLSASPSPSPAVQVLPVDPPTEPQSEAETHSYAVEPLPEVCPVPENNPSLQHGGGVNASVQTDIDIDANLQVSSDAATSDTNDSLAESSTPKSPQDVPEAQAANIWSLAYGRLQKKLLDEEIFEWLAICGLHVRPRRGLGDAFQIAPNFVESQLCLIVDILQDAAPERENVSEFYKDEGYEEDEDENDDGDNDDGNEDEDEDEGESEDKGEDMDEDNDEDEQSNKAVDRLHGIHTWAGTPQQIMGAALQAHPYASLAWAASYITLQSLVDASSLPDEPMYSQIISAIEKMEWYVSLFRLVFWNSQQKPPIPSSPVVHALVALYESILLYQVRAAIQVAKHPEQISLEWEADEIQDRMDTFVARFSRLNLQPQISTLAEKASTKEEVELPELLAKLHVGPIQMPPSNAQNSHILEHLFASVSKTQAYDEFIQWSAEHARRILWISGGPGVGKTTLLQAFTQRLQAKPDKHVAFFFHDGTKRREEDALSVVKGLICAVLSDQPDLSDHLEAMFTVEYAGSKLNQRKDFDAPGDFSAMSMLLCRIIQDNRFQATYFVLDGVNELSMEGDQFELERLVATTVKLSNKVKWVLSVDREPFAGKESQRQLDLGKHLESDARISREYAVNAVANISHVVGYNVHVLDSLLEVLDHAPSNFLWTRMALDIVQASTLPWNSSSVLAKLAKDAPSVQSLYAWRWSALHELAVDGMACYETILSITAAVFRPLAVSECAAISNLPPAVQLDFMVDKVLPGFLTISDDTVHFVHSSARDFIRHEMESQIQDRHATIARRCLILLLMKLDCSCASVHDSLNSSTDSHIGIDYAIAMWIRHVSEPGGRDDPKAVDLAIHLLSVHLIEWVELLGSRNAILKSLNMMHQLYNSISTSEQSPMSQVVNHKDHGHTIAGNSLHIIREVILFMQLCQHRETPNRNRNRNQIEGSTDKMMSWLPNQLLFATSLPTLRNILVPGRFPWLEIPPAIGLEDDSTSCLHVIQHDDCVQGCCFSPDGRLVASASDDRHVRVWDVQTGSIQACFGGFDDYAIGVVMSSTTTMVAFSSHVIKAWDVESGKCIFTLSGLPLVEGIDLSPCGNMLVAATKKGLIVWEDLSESVTKSTGVAYCGESTTCVTFSPDGNLIASAEGSKIRVWNAQVLKEAVYTLPMISPGPREAGQDETVPGIQPSSNGDGGTIKAVSGHTDDIHELAFSPDSIFLVSGSYDRTARVWDLRTCQTVAIFAYHSSFVDSVSFSPDGSFIATGSRDRAIAIWRHTSPGNWGGGETRSQPDRVLSGHTRPVWSVAFSPTSSSLLTSASLDNSLRIWNMDMDTISGTTSTGQVQMQMQSHQQGICGMAISPDDNMIASASSDGMVCLWDSKTGKQLRMVDKVQGHVAEVRTMEFSPDCNLLITASIDGIALIWNVADSTDQQRTPLTPRLCFKHSDWVRDVSFEPEGQWVATACKDSRVRVLDVSQARTTTHSNSAVQILPSKTFEARVGRVYSVAFSTNGKRLASGGNSRQVCIWDVGVDDDDDAEPESGSDKAKSCICGVVFSDDGSKVVSVSMDGSIAVWTEDASRHLRCKIVKKTWGDHIGPFRKMRFDPAYPGVIFTEHGLIWVDLNKGVGKKRDGNGEDCALQRWSIPPSGVYKTSIKWNDYVIDLPAYCKVEDEPFFWCQQGKMIVVGGRDGQLLLFRFKEAANPRLNQNRREIW